MLVRDFKAGVKELFDAQEVAVKRVDDWNGFGECYLVEVFKYHHGLKRFKYSVYGKPMVFHLHASAKVSNGFGDLAGFYAHLADRFAW